MAFSEHAIEEVWQKGITVEGYDSNRYRQDVCKAWIMRTEYGNINSALGWEIDHVFPQSKGGKDDLINLRPMQHQNNASKADNYPVYKAVITSDGNKNIGLEKEYTVNKELQDQLANLHSNR
jgi:hypothetical protein